MGDARLPVDGWISEWVGRLPGRFRVDEQLKEGAQCGNALSRKNAGRHERLPAFGVRFG